MQFYLQMFYLSIGIMQFFAFQLICPSISKLRRFSFSQYLCWCFHCHCYFHCNICCFKSPSKGISNFLTGWSRHVPLWLFNKRFFNQISLNILDVLGVPSRDVGTLWYLIFVVLSCFLFVAWTALYNYKLHSCRQWMMVLLKMLINWCDNVA